MLQMQQRVEILSMEKEILFIYQGDDLTSATCA